MEDECLGMVTELIDEHDRYKFVPSLHLEASTLVDDNKSIYLVPKIYYSMKDY